MYRSQAILEERGWFNFPGNRVSLIYIVYYGDRMYARGNRLPGAASPLLMKMHSRTSLFPSPPPFFSSSLFPRRVSVRIRSQVSYISRSPLFLNRSSLFNVARLAKNAAFAQHTADAVGAPLYRRLFLIVQLLSYRGADTLPTENTGYRHIYVFIGSVGATLQTEIPRSCFLCRAN